jgi:hypothetical protein
LLQATRVHEDIYDRSIDVQVLRLRRRLEADPSAPRMILTERGVGYIFALTVYRNCNVPDGNDAVARAGQARLRRRAMCAGAGREPFRSSLLKVVFREDEPTIATSWQK